MVHSSLSINFTPVGFSDSYSLSMEQDDIPEYLQKANLQDIVGMFNRALGGLTSFSYNRNRDVYISGNNLILDLSFTVWTVPFDLEYNLSIASGTFSQGTIESFTKERNIIVPLSNTYEFPHEVTVNSFEWVTPCFNRFGNRLSINPTFSVSGNRIDFSETVFGVARVNYNAIGHSHVVTLSFPKTTGGIEKVKGIVLDQVNFNKISNVDTTVIAKYVDVDGEEKQESLQLKIPENVLHALEQCTSDGSLVVNSCRGRDKQEVVTYYYSACTGEVLDVNREIINPCED